MPSLEERIEALETTLARHIAATAPLKRDVESLTELGAKSFVSLNLQLNRLETTVGSLQSTANRHSDRFDEHAAILKGHTEDLVALKDDVGQILTIVSGQKL